MAVMVQVPMDMAAFDTDAKLQVSPSSDSELFEVIGGAGSGGIIVREGQEKTSAEKPERLATGSVVRLVGGEAGRVLYELVRGVGPASGWVSAASSGRQLLAKICDHDALKSYGQRLAEARVAGKGDFIYDRDCSPSTACKGVAKKIVAETASAELALQAEQQKTQVPSARRSSAALSRLLGKHTDVVEDSDGERVAVCRHCRLPLGEYAYAQDGKSQSLMHGECVAQVMLQNRRREEEERLQREAEVKQARREEYDIGWRHDAIPCNAEAATRLGCDAVPQGLCCLVLEEDAVRLAPTFEPAGALNLEYLSVALRVRRAEGREPFFSLDPVEPGRREAAEGAMQAKRFEPEWLAETSVGEVMFQADYHLKELSMGEHDQPVIGMRSCFDFARTSDFEEGWSAREWFVVRQAEIHVSEDGVVVPYLRMGVEAREQTLGADGALEDAPLTRPDHPLVRYAEAFTRNFDLIAERKSVVAQLREVAKASVVAKFLLESGVQLDDRWLSLCSPSGLGCCLEVPQLWNDRCFSQILATDGEIASSEKAHEAKVHGVYGGVDFGIDRFRLAAPSRVATSVVAGRAALGRPASTLMATSQAGLSMAPGQRFTRLAAPLSARAALTAPSRLAPPLSARAGLAAPLSAMAAARPATSLMATSRASMAAPQARLAAPLRASMAAPSRLAAPLTARASLAAPLSAMAGARPATSLMATSRLSVGAPGRLAAPLSAMTAARPASSLMATSRISMAAPQTATARLSMGMPRGVDLNLDRFNLSAVSQDGVWAGSLEAPPGSEKHALDTDAFWRALEEGSDSAVLVEEDRRLFASVFNPCLSDRRQDGSRFVPPATGLSHVHRLKMLTKEEAKAKQLRKDHFFSADFVADAAGPLFPSSWTSSIDMASSAPAPLVARPDLEAEAGMLRDILASTAPSFEKTTEDGTRFLIFKFGSLEARATQEPQGDLEVGAVFSVSDAWATAPGASDLEGGELVVKVAECVERAPSGVARYFLLVETDAGTSATVGLLPSGAVSWTACAPGRCAQAKVLRTHGCEDSGVTVGELRASLQGAKKASASSQKRFVQAAFLRLAGSVA